MARKKRKSKKKRAVRYIKPSRGVQRKLGYNRSEPWFLGGAAGQVGGISMIHQVNKYNHAVENLESLRRYTGRENDLKALIDRQNGTSSALQERVKGWEKQREDIKDHFAKVIADEDEKHTSRYNRHERILKAFNERFQLSNESQGEFNRDVDNLARQHTRMKDRMEAIENSQARSQQEQDKTQSAIDTYSKSQLLAMNQIGQLQRYVADQKTQEGADRPIPVGDKTFAEAGAALGASTADSTPTRGPKVAVGDETFAQVPALGASTVEEEDSSLVGSTPVPGGSTIGDISTIPGKRGGVRDDERTPQLEAALGKARRDLSGALADPKGFKPSPLTTKSVTFAPEGTPGATAFLSKLTPSTLAASPVATPQARIADQNRTAVRELNRTFIDPAFAKKEERDNVKRAATGALEAAPASAEYLVKIQQERERDRELALRAQESKERLAKAREAGQNLLASPGKIRGDSSRLDAEGNIIESAA